MAFWNKPVTDPEKQLKKLKKYCMQVLGLSKEEAEKKIHTFYYTQPLKFIFEYAYSRLLKKIIH